MDAETRDDISRACVSKETLERRVKELEAEVARLREAESNFLTYGQGGASYHESQWIDKLAGAEHEKETLERRVKALEEDNRRLHAACLKSLRLLVCWHDMTCGEDTWALREDSTYETLLHTLRNSPASGTGWCTDWDPTA